MIVEPRAQRTFTAFLTVAFLGWSITWCCGHTVVNDLFELFENPGHHHGDADDCHRHAHGPFEHSHELPTEAGDHELAKIGVDRCLTQEEELAAALVGPALSPVALPARSAGERLAIARLARAPAGPDPPRARARDVLHSTERWLI